MGQSVLRLFENTVFQLVAEVGQTTSLVDSDSLAAVIVFVDIELEDGTVIDVKQADSCLIVQSFIDIDEPSAVEHLMQT